MEPLSKEDEKIDNLVEQFLIDRSEKNKLLILESFDNYFKKYTSLLCTANAVDFSNKDTTKFLRLFMSKE
jgi:hypothetical protein